MTRHTNGMNADNGVIINKGGKLMKKALSLFLVLAMIIGLCSFASAEDAKSYSFEIVSKGFQSTYWQAVLKGCEAETKTINDAAGYEKVKFNM